MDRFEEDDDLKGYKKKKGRIERMGMAGFVKS